MAVFRAPCRTPLWGRDAGGRVADDPGDEPRDDSATEDSPGPWRADAPREDSAGDAPSQPAPPADAAPEESRAWRVTLRDSELIAVSASLKPLASCLRNPLLTFGPDGMIVQGSVCGQRVFVPVHASSFSEYSWRGPAAVFLALTDTRRTLMDPFRHDKKRTPREIAFNFHGESPCRNLTQTATYSGASEECTYSTTLVKYELWTSMTLCPNADPDVEFSFNRHQMGKVVGLASRLQHEEMVFAVKPEGGFYVGTVCEVLAFEVDGSDMRQYPFDGRGAPGSRGNAAAAAVLQAAGAGDGADAGSPASGPSGRGRRRAAGQAAAPCRLVGRGSGRPFCVGLEDTHAFKSLLQKIRPGASGMDLRFYTESAPDMPMMCIRLHTSASPSAFMFCTPDCIPIHELEEVSCTAGAVRVKLAGQPPPLPPSPTAEDGEGERPPPPRPARAATGRKRPRATPAGEGRPQHHQPTLEESMAAAAAKRPKPTPPE